jgi:integrase
MKKQADGRYRNKVVVGHDADGEPIVKYASGRTQKELQANLKELKRRFGAGGPGALAEVTFGEYAERWLDTKRGSVGDGTWDTYASYVRQHLTPALGQRQVRAILQSDLKLVMAELAKKGLADNTRKMSLLMLKGIMTQAQDDHIRDDNPARSIKQKRDNDPKRRALTAEEVKATLEYLEALPDTDGAKMLGIIYYTSCRRGECFGLQWKHIDFKGRKIKVCQQLRYQKGGGGQITPKLKTKNSYRELPLPRQLHEILHPLRGHPEAFVFQLNGEHYRPCDAEDLWDAIVEEEPRLAEVTPHYYRHNYATRLYKKDVPVKEAARYMGETVKTMLDIYVHIEQEIGVEEDSRVYDVFEEEVAEKLPGSFT